MSSRCNEVAGGGLSLSLGHCSEIGTRSANEDFVGWTGAPACFTAAIADGVGGAKGGRVAAECAVRLLVDAQSEPGFDPQAGAARALRSANLWVHAQGRTDPALADMAATLTALLLHGRRGSVLHVGDTRLYQLRDGALSQLTTDHVTRSGAVRHVLTRALGAEAELRLDSATFAIRQHDRYLLCSDGVWGGVPDRRLREMLAERRAAGDTARALVRAALASRIGDNATALVVDVLGLPPFDHAELEAEMRTLPLLPPPRTGAVIDGHRLGPMLADGRYSRVFRASDVQQRPVILKFPKPAAGAEPLLRLAFLREAWIAARLRSPFVGEVIELAAADRSCLYTVMPFYDGETLEQRLRRAPPIPLAGGIADAIRLAKGVAALHRAGVVHRDIKPDNVVLERAGGLRLLDFGVARLPGIEDVPTGDIGVADIPGTPSYMAPEMFAGAAGDVRSDVFALGVTVYRMFARAYPYGELEPFSRPRFDGPAPLSRHRPDLPAWLDDVLSRAVAIQPEDRPADALEFAFALEHGALQAAPGRRPRQSLLDRNPLRFYQILSVVLAVLLTATMAAVLGR